MDNKKTKWLPWLIIVVVLSLGLNLYFVAQRRSAGGGSETASAKEMYQCPMHPQIIQDHPGDCPICGMKLVLVRKTEPEEDAHAMGASDSTMQSAERRILFYRNPMNPSITSPVLRKDEMGMDYIPVYSDAVSGGLDAVEGRAEVTIDPTRQQLIGLRTAIAERSQTSGSWRTVGRVTVDPTRVHKINVKVAGYVEKIYVDFVGRTVRRGEALFTLYSPELLTAQQEYLLALRARSNAPGNANPGDDALVAAARQKLALWDISDAQIKHLEETGEPTKVLTFVSPVSGVVTAKDVVQGSSLMMGDAPYEVTDLSEVWVLADVYQSDLARVKVGMPATFTSTSLSGQAFRGKVAFLDPLLDPASRTLKVRLNVENSDGQLKPEMFGDVVLESLSRNALTIPADAIIPTGTRYMVFVSSGNGKFQPRAVELGEKANERVEVTAGLKEGEEVVTRANFLVDSESSLRAALAATSTP